MSGITHTGVLLHSKFCFFQLLCSSFRVTDNLAQGSSALQKVIARLHGSGAQVEQQVAAMFQEVQTFRQMLAQ